MSLNEPPDKFGLQRFVDAQNGVSSTAPYADALQEVKAGKKRSHWMWFVFPQVEGLGSSEKSKYFAIHSREEAAAYLAHPVLGPRLVEITEALLSLPITNPSEIFGAIDSRKLQSSMTLFEAVSPEGSPFSRVIDLLYSNGKCGATLSFLGG